MNAPFLARDEALELADLSDRREAARIEAYIAERDDGLIFHRPLWLRAVSAGTGQKALGLVARKGPLITGWLPLTEVHSPLFGRALVSTGFAVGGGVLADHQRTANALGRAAAELAQRRCCSAVELRGGAAPDDWSLTTDSHANFARPLAADDEAELLAIPRKQRAEVRKGLREDLELVIGSDAQNRADHYRVYAESVRNLGTPVFPRQLFAAMLDHFGEDADILTLRHQGEPVASVLSFYHKGAVMPYWGGGVWAARRLRANDRMYYELMLHARARGMSRFDFGRSKLASGAYAFKKNWGFEPESMRYASWSAPGAAPRDLSPNNAAYSRKIALWQKLPLGLANRIGPWIARGLA